MGEADRQALVTRVFAAYLALMRKVQTTYWCAQAHGHHLAVPCCRPFCKVLAHSANAGGAEGLEPACSHSTRALVDSGGLRDWVCIQTCMPLVVALGRQTGRLEPAGSHGVWGLDET